MNLVKCVFRGEDGHQKAIHRTTDRCEFEGRGSGDSGQKISRNHNIWDPAFYTWRKKYRAMGAEDIRRLKQLEAENQKLKRLLADSMLDNDASKTALSKKYLPHETSVRQLR